MPHGCLEISKASPDQLSDLIELGAGMGAILIELLQLVSNAHVKVDSLRVAVQDDRL